MLEGNHDDLVKDVVPAQGNVQLYGQEGHAKSWGALELAVALATGTPWFGTFDVPRPVKTLYVATERARTTAERLVQGYDLGGPIPNLTFTSEEFHLDKPETMHGWGPAFAEKGIEAVIFDTLARNHGTTPWRGEQVLQSFSSLQKHVAVITINHTMKGVTDPYGGGAMLNSQDCRMLFTKLGDNTYDVECKKLSAGEQWPPFQFRIINNRPQLWDNAQLHVVGDSSRQSPEQQVIQIAEHKKG